MCLLADGWLKILNLISVAYSLKSCFPLLQWIQSAAALRVVFYGCDSMCCSHIFLFIFGDEDISMLAFISG